jgi:adenylate cyclase
LAAPAAIRWQYASHLLDHALLNISVSAADAMLSLQMWIWQGVLGTIALYGALATHASLGLWALYERRHFGWTTTEVVQLALGLSIPLLLANHLFVTRISFAAFGTLKLYQQELYSFWVARPDLGLLQITALVVIWIHGCIGLYLWLRLKPSVARWMPVLLCAAVVLPMLALLGDYQGGRTIQVLVHDPAWRAANLQPGQIGTPAQNAALTIGRNRSIVGFVGLVGLVLLARAVRAARERWGGTFLVTYPERRNVRVPIGFSVLEASRAGGVPHTSICGGRGRCSTCRIRVMACTAPVPEPHAGEQAVLDRVALRPPVRLACQLRPLGDIVVVPLLAPHRAADALGHREASRPGEERFVVVMVVDMRNSTRLAETCLPYDTVFIVDRFIGAVDAGVIEAGGRAAQFTGDGLVALFGIDSEPEEACRQAIEALVRIGRNVAALNKVLIGVEMAEPIRFGAGVAAGEAVVGEVHYAGARGFTTLGNAANVASRLESLCKTYTCEAVIADDVCTMSGLALADLPRRETALRGREAALVACTVDRLEQLAPLVARPGAS